jgi:hypothetical protein
MTNFLKHKMRGKSPGEIAGWVILGILGIAGLAILFGFIIMWLWNALMPDIFGLPTLTYWQAVGLFMLSKILIGCGSSGGGKSSKSDKKGKDKCGGKNGKNDFSKWKQYDKFWEEEGDQLYKDYVSRKENGDSNETPLIENENN